jgi:hypothetical protein
MMFPRELLPQRLKPLLLTEFYRSAEALRHPKTFSAKTFGAKIENKLSQQTASHSLSASWRHG